MQKITTNIFEEALLRYVKPDQLKQIQSVKIGIGGAGGLGSNVAIILVRSGFKNLEIIDHDVIEPSNLNRQQYFANEVGLPKVEVLGDRLLSINPDLNLKLHRIKWTPNEGAEYFKNCDYIIEAFDAAEWKHKFVDYYNDKTKYVVSGIGMAGLSVKRPMTVKRLGNIFICGDTQTDSAAGHPPMAPRVTQCAAMMAEIVLDLALEIIK